MEAFVGSIQQRFDYVRSKIDQAARSVSRQPEEIRLVVVTKAQPIEVVRAAIEAGACLLGENYPEETLPKIQALSSVQGIAWHMIGHLQSRKAGLIAEHFDMLESLDSLHLAEKLERLLTERNRVLPVLLEVNVSGEQSKSGFAGWNESQWDQLLPEFEQILGLPHLSVQGLMTMPPLFVDPEQSRPYFVKLRHLADCLGTHLGHGYFMNYPWEPARIIRSQSRRARHTSGSELQLWALALLKNKVRFGTKHGSIILLCTLSVPLL